MESLYIENEILIDASPDKVWQTLIDPEMTKIYMFGCEVLSSWKIGEQMLWKGAHDGVIYVKGKLLIFDQEKTFSFTVFDPNDSYEDIPENYLTATYRLSGKGGETLLKVTQGDYAAVAAGEKRYKHTMDQGGWFPVLEGIKKCAKG